LQGSPWVHEMRKRAWLPSGVGPGECFDIAVFQKTRVDIALWQEKHISREGALGALSTNVDVGLAVLRKRGTSPEGGAQYELIEYFQRACSDDISGEAILEGGSVYRLQPLCFCQVLEAAPRCAVLAVHSVYPIELEKAKSSWRDVAWATFEGARKQGHRWNDRSHRGLTYFLSHEPGGCTFAVENSSAKPVAVQMDASDSLGCVSSRGDFGAVIQVKPQSRQVALVLAFSPGAAYTCASVLPQQVPLDMAPPTEAGDSLHAPLPLLPETWPPQSEADMQLLRRTAPVGSQQDDDDDLEAEIKLSVEVNQQSTSRATEHSTLPGDPRGQLQALVKERFAALRSQGVAPNEAAARAMDEARGNLGTAATAS